MPWSPEGEQAAAAQQDEGEEVRVADVQEPREWGVQGGER